VGPRGAESGPGGLSPGDWARLLGAELGARVEVRYGRARSSVVSARVEPRSGAWHVRLNAMFADAPEEVQAALARWLRSGRRARRACATLDGWIDARLQRLHREQPAPLELAPCGRHHDLEPLARELVAGELAGDFPSAEDLPRITWGARRPSRSRRSLRLGSFDYGARLVRIHPVLDQPAVPRWFVRYVLFHELLHAALDEPRRKGRRVLHGPEFRRRERAYPDFTRAQRWEREHIDALIRSARRGRDLASPPAPVRQAQRWVQALLFGDPS
jgi:hypothetical protein